MANSKVRCTICREYKPRAEVLRAGTNNVCSDACRQEAFARARSRAEIKRSQPKPVSPEKVSQKKKRAKQDIPQKVREEVLIRDGYRCRWCGTIHNTHAHHILYRSQGGPHEPWNLITLCLVHHEKVHSNKRLYQPILLGLIWLEYVDGKYLTVPQFERFYSRLL